ncbi:MAG: type sorting protein [Bacteroidetes bacterium]|nr:type sorting protein [Bacteroidota bacterium]
MKRTLLLTSILLLQLSSIFAQNSARVIDTRHDLFSAGSWSYFDSAHYTYSGSRGGIDPESSSAANYDQGLRLIPSGIAWATDSRTTKTYDASDRELTSIVQVMSGGNWLNYSKTYNNYDANGDLIESGGQGWDSVGAVWRDGEIFTNTYDANHHRVTSIGDNHYSHYKSMDSLYYNGSGQMIINIYFTYDSLTGYQYAAMTQYEYNAQGKQTKMIQYTRNAGVWENYQIDSTTYTGTDPTTSVAIIWTSGTWQTGHRTTYEYDAMHNDTLSTYYLSDSLHQGWRPSSRSIAVYNGTNDRTLMTQQQYSNNTWQNSQQTAMTYNNTHGELLYIIRTWSAGAWLDNTKYESTFNSNGYKTSILLSNYTGGSWVPTGRYYYWYEDVNGISEVKKNIDTKAYPDPCRDKFEIAYSADKAGAATLRLYDLSGKLVSTTETSTVTGDNHISWEAFALSGGMYIYELSIPGATGRGKVMVE